MDDQLNWYYLAKRFPALIDKQVYQSLTEEDLQTLIKLEQLTDKEIELENKKWQTTSK